MCLCSIYHYLTKSNPQKSLKKGGDPMKKEYALILHAALATVGAYLSDKLGILFPVLCVLAMMMAVDYLTGMLASKAEALEYPGNPDCGWSSRKGAKGIIKKVSYLCVITVALVVDYLITSIAGEIGIHSNMNAFFGLLVTVWYLLNELLSIVENAGRMGADVPEWLRKYIAVLKDKIDTQDHEQTKQPESNKK